MIHIKSSPFNNIINELIQNGIAAIRIVGRCCYIMMQLFQNFISICLQSSVITTIFAIRFMSVFILFLFIPSLFAMESLKNGERESKQSKTWHRHRYESRVSPKNCAYINFRHCHSARYLLHSTLHIYIFIQFDAMRIFICLDSFGWLLRCL